MSFLPQIETGKRRAVMLAAVVLAAVLRLGFWGGSVGFNVVGSGDEPEYHDLATEVAEGNGLVGENGKLSAFRPPLYPVVLGGLYAMTGPDPDAGRALQVIMGVIVVVLVYAVCTRVFSKRVSLLAAMLAAFNPALIYVSALLLTENLYLILLLLVLFLTLGSESGKVRAARFAGAGVAAGLLPLTRPSGLAFALLAAAAMLLPSRAAVRTRVARVAVFVALAAAVMAPWVIRNQRVFGEFIATTTHGGVNFYACNNQIAYDEPAFHGNVVLPLRLLPGSAEFLALDEVERDRRCWELGITFIKEHKGLQPAMVARRFKRFWRFDTGRPMDVTRAGLTAGGRRSGVPWREIDIGFVYWIVVVPLFLIGLIATLRRRTELVLLYVVIVAHLLVALAFFGSLRVRSPAEPVIVCFAAAGVSWLVRMFRHRTRRGCQ